MTMILDAVCHVAGDPSGAKRRAQAALPPRLQRAALFAAGEPCFGAHAEAAGLTRLC
jgi:hypothetical protein